MVCSKCGSPIKFLSDDGNCANCNKVTKNNNVDNKNHRMKLRDNQKIYIAFILIGMIIGTVIIVNKKEKKQEQDAYRIAMEKYLQKADEAIRTRNVENSKREQEENQRIEQALRPLRLKCLNLIANNIPIQELLRILIEYDSGRHSVSYITSGLRYSISIALSGRGIRFVDSIADYILEEDIVYQPLPITIVPGVEKQQPIKKINVSTDEMADWTVQEFYAHRDKFRNIPVDERANTYGRFILEGNIFVYEGYRK
jgi:F0F1-type ATP synthase assembly protein I